MHLILTYQKSIRVYFRKWYGQSEPDLIQFHFKQLDFVVLDTHKRCNN